MAECYKDVKQLIFRVVDRFHTRYGGELQEYLSIGNLAFVEAFHTFDSTKSIFTTWVYNKVYNALGDHYRKELRRQRGDTRTEVKSSKTYEMDTLFELTADLDNDARSILQLIFETPQDLYHLICDDGGDNKKVKHIIAGYLKSNGWTRQRVAKSYNQITQVIYD